MYETLNTSSLQFLSVRRCYRGGWHQLRRRRRRSLIYLTKTSYALYKELITCTTFLARCDTRACVHEFNITSWEFQPSLILRVGKMMCVSGISITHTKFNDQCSYVKISNNSFQFIQSSWSVCHIVFSYVWFNAILKCESPSQFSHHNEGKGNRWPESGSNLVMHANIPNMFQTFPTIHYLCKPYTITERERDLINFPVCQKCRSIIHLPLSHVLQVSHINPPHT